MCESLALDDDELQVLQAILDGREAWTSAEDLAAAFQRPAEQVSVVLVRLNRGGWVECWSHSVRPRALYTLSPLGASRLKVHLVEDGPSEVLRWSPDAVSLRSRRRRDPDDAKAERLDQVPDRQPTPQEAAEAWETVLRRFRPRSTDDLPWPTVLAGMGDPLWRRLDEFDRRNPEISSDGQTSLFMSQNLQDGRRCVGCGGRKLGSSEACGRCLRWGLDGFFATLRRQAEARAAG